MFDRRLLADQDALVGSRLGSQLAERLGIVLLHLLVTVEGFCSSFLPFSRPLSQDLIALGLNDRLKSLDVLVEQRQALVYSAVARVHDLVRDLSDVLRDPRFELGKQLPAS